MKICEPGRAFARMLVAVAIASCRIARNSHAASVYWDGNSQVGIPGDGRTWSNPDNWSSNGIDDLPPTDIAPGDILAFGGGTIGTITLGQNRVASSLYFYQGFSLDNAGATDVLTVSTGNLSVFEDQKPVTINAVVASSNGLSIQGSDQQSVIALTGINTYTGTTGLANCTLDIQADFNLGNSANPVLLNNATLSVSSTATFNRGFTCTGAGGNISAATGIDLTITGSMNASGGGLTLTGGGVLNLTGSSTLAALNDSTGTVVFKPAMLSAISIGTLSLGGGSLDLTNADLILHTPGTTSVAAMLASGFNKGKWNGPGIISSAAAADLSHSKTLGYFLNDNGSGQTLVTTFDGQSVVSTDTIVKYTYYGDANLDGQVDGSDYSRIDSGFLTHATGWCNGDFNYDGVINGSDYTLIDNAFNNQSATQSAEVDATVRAGLSSDLAAASSVPEPAILAPLMLFAASALRRRRSDVYSSGLDRQ